MKKIMFNDKYGLTEAVLSGRKTQTRRIIPQSVVKKTSEYQLKYFEATLDAISEREAIEQIYFVERLANLPYQVGEVVAVAQSYKDAGFDPNMLQTTPIKGVGIVDAPISTLPGWTNKMFTFPSMMSHQIRITNVQIERLQDISDEDCIKEGVVEACVNNNWGNCASHWEYNVPYEDGLGRARLLRGLTPQEAYTALIDRISGKGTWEHNPWVFVYDFELVK